MATTDAGETRMTVRLPSDLVARLRQAAEQDRRSINSQLVVLLERALDAVESTP
jgi:hypothetical protein